MNKKTLFCCFLMAFAGFCAQAAQRVTESPTGTIDGTNKVFRLSTMPYSDTLRIHMNGVRLLVNVDYTLSSQSVTLQAAPINGDAMVAEYDALVPSGYRMLVNKATNSCVMPNSSNRLVPISCAGTDVQKLTATQSTFGFVMTVKSTGLVLDLNNSAVSDGTLVVQNTSSGSKGQQWLLAATDNDPFFQITNTLTNNASCLTVSGASVVLQTCSGLDTQKWQWQ